MPDRDALFRASGFQRRASVEGWWGEGTSPMQGEGFRFVGESVGLLPIGIAVVVQVEGLGLCCL